MDMPTLVIGIFALVFSSVTLVMRFTHSGSQKALALMQERFGNATGTFIHLAGYTVIPALFGALCVYLALHGESIFISSHH